MYALSAGLWGVLAHAGVALACPSCPVGRAARQQVCEDDFALRLFAVLVPFLVMGVVSMWFDRGRGNV